MIHDYIVPNATYIGSTEDHDVWNIGDTNTYRCVFSVCGTIYEATVNPTLCKTSYIEQLHKEYDLAAAHHNLMV